MQPSQPVVRGPDGHDTGESIGLGLRPVGPFQPLQKGPQRLCCRGYVPPYAYFRSTQLAR